MDTQAKKVYTSINEAMQEVHEMAANRGAGIVTANDFGSRGQYFSVTIGNKELFFSYATLVAVNAPDGGGQLRSDSNFSPTTSRHMGRMGVSDWNKVPQEELENIAAGA